MQGQVGPNRALGTEAPSARADRRGTERRRAERRGADLTVFLYASGVPIAVARAHDASLQGLQVTPEPALDGLDLGARLEVGLELEDGAITRRVRAPVRVAHAAPSRIGLAFTVVDPEIAPVIRAVIRGAVHRRALEDSEPRLERFRLLS